MRKRVYEFRPTYSGRPAGAPEIFLTRSAAASHACSSHVRGRIVRSTEDAEVVDYMREHGVSWRQAWRQTRG